MTGWSLMGAVGETTDRVVLQLAWLAFSSWMVWNGVKVWQGHELRRVEAFERSTGRWWPSAWGTNRRYKTWLGSGYLGVVFGAGFSLISVTDLVRLTLGQDEDWGPWWAASILGVALAGIGVAGVMAYFWTGLPDGLRPPCQRGWEVVDGDWRLVRGGETLEERRERLPLIADPGRRATTGRRGAPPTERQ